MLYENIKKLVQYGVETGLTPACEKNYTINLLLDVFKEDEYVEPEEDIEDGDIYDTSKVEAFLVPAGTGVELSDAASCTGTEGILEQIRKRSTGSNGLLL